MKWKKNNPIHMYQQIRPVETTTQYPSIANYFLGVSEWFAAVEWRQGIWTTKTSARCEGSKKRRKEKAVKIETKLKTKKEKSSAGKPQRE